MPPTGTIDLIDRERDGAVSRQIQAWRTEGLSVNEVAFRLREIDVKVDPKTVTRWLKRQELAAS